MPDIKKYATSVMKKQNLENSIEKEWKKDRFFLPGQIEDADREPQFGKTRQSSSRKTNKRRI